MKKRIVSIIIAGVIAFSAMVAGVSETSATNPCEEFQRAWRIMEGIFSFASDSVILGQQPGSGGRQLFVYSNERSDGHVRWAKEVNHQMARKFGPEYAESVPLNRDAWRKQLEQTGWKWKQGQPYNATGQHWVPNNDFTPPCLPPPAGPKALEGWAPEQLVTVTAPSDWKPLDIRAYLQKVWIPVLVLLFAAVILGSGMLIFARKTA